MRNVAATQEALNFSLCCESSCLGMTAGSMNLRKESKWEKRSMFQRRNGLDIKNASDYMVTQRML